MVNLRKSLFKKSLTNTAIFRQIVRRVAYLEAKGDPEKVHELALKALNENLGEINSVSHQFDFIDLYVEIGGRSVTPIGSAAGLDKDCEALLPLSKLFGFQTVGTIVLNPRIGNNRPRVLVDQKRDEIYNAQGFPSKGLKYSLENLIRFREGDKDSVIIEMYSENNKTTTRVSTRVKPAFSVERLAFSLPTILTIIFCISSKSASAFEKSILTYKSFAIINWVSNSAAEASAILKKLIYSPRPFLL